MTEQKPSTFFLDDKEVDIRAGETIFRAARRVDIKLPHLCYTPKPGYRPDGNCRVCMVGDRGRAGAGGKLHPHADARHEGQDPDRPRQDRAADGRRTAAGRSARHRGRARSGLRAVEDRRSGRRSSPAASRAMRGPTPDRSHPAMAVNLDACIHCNLCVRACREVQVNDVIGMAGRGHTRQDRVRLRRPDGRLDLRRLRRMRAGLPDRRADAGDAGRRAERPHRISRPRGRQRLPVLRRRLPAHLPHQGRQADFRRRPQRPGQPEPAVRQGPLRLRLRDQPAAAD